MTFELSADGKLVLNRNPIRVDSPPSISESEAQIIIEKALSERQLLPLPDYVPEDRKDIVLKYLSQFQEEVWNKAVERWKTSNRLTKEDLLLIYKMALPHHFLSTNTLVPSKNPNNITENTYAIADQVAVDNVVNCTGGILESTHKVGFHILGFTQIENIDNPITPEAGIRVKGYIDQLLDVLGEPPEKITLNASTLGKQIDNLDKGHEFVEQTFREVLTLRYPEKYPNPQEIIINKVQSPKLSSLPV